MFTYWGTIAAILTCLDHPMLRLKCKQCPLNNVAWFRIHRFLIQRSVMQRSVKKPWFSCAPLLFLLLCWKWKNGLVKISGFQIKGPQINFFVKIDSHQAVYFVIVFPSFLFLGWTNLWRMYCLLLTTHFENLNHTVATKQLLESTRFISSYFLKDSV